MSIVLKFVESYVEKFSLLTSSYFLSYYQYVEDVNLQLIGVLIVTYYYDFSLKLAQSSG